MLAYKRRYNHRAKLSDDELVAIEEELKNLAYDKIEKKEDFCLVDLVGDNWDGLEVQTIYDKYAKDESLKCADNKTVTKKAALDAGYILKNIIIDDSRHYFVCYKKKRNGKWNNYYKVIE